MQVRKQQLELDKEQQIGSKLGKEYVKAVYCHPTYLTFISNLRYADNTTLMAESEGELKSLLVKVKEESEKGGLKLNIQKTNHSIWSHHFMGNRWGNSGNSVRLYFGGSKITADGDCSHEIKRCFLLGRKVMTNLDSIFKSRDITSSTKVRLVKAMVFPVVM